jgi:hypothetical protein
MALRSTTCSLATTADVTDADWLLLNIQASIPLRRFSWADVVLGEPKLVPDGLNNGDTAPPVGLDDFRGDM